MSKAKPRSSRCRRTDLWLRQGDEKQQSVIHALRVADQGQHLEDVIVFLYGADDHFTGRIDAKTGQLQDQAWLLRDAWVFGHQWPAGASRHLSPEHDADAGTDPGKLRLARHAVVLGPAGLHPRRPGRRLLGHALPALSLHPLALPALFAAMVFMAASFSLRLSREGGVAKVILFSAACGFARLFLLRPHPRAGPVRRGAGAAGRDRARHRRHPDRHDPAVQSGGRMSRAPFGAAQAVAAGRRAHSLAGAGGGTKRRPLAPRQIRRSRRCRRRPDSAAGRSDRL